jgi:hypothetical protein
MNQEPTEVVGTRFDGKTIALIDDARVKISTGSVTGRSGFVKAAVYFYLGYLGYDAPKPESGSRRKKNK